MREQPQRALAIGNYPFGQFIARVLADGALRDSQDVRPLRNEVRRWQRFVSRTLQADEFGYVFEVLAENEVLAFGDDRYVTNTELQQALPPAGIVQDVDMLVIDALTRKKLFRPETAASPRLSEQNEFFGDGVHGRLDPWREEQDYYPARSRVKARPLPLVPHRWDANCG
jgi:hypothetical protein